MSVIIKDAKAPKNCAECWYSKGVYCLYPDTGGWVGEYQKNQTKPEWCPISEVVRCKDCKWFEDVEDYCLCTHPDYGRYTQTNGFCENGEEK